jgi:hypothetical protein
MLTLGNTYLDYEKGGIAKVRCSRCREQIGRVQVTPLSAEDDSVVWEEEVQGELDVLSREHEFACDQRQEIIV